jgi:hypothetical protein
MTAGDGAAALVLRLLETARWAAPALVIPAAEALAAAFLVTFVVLEVILLVLDVFAPKVAMLLVTGALFVDWTGRVPRRSGSLMPQYYLTQAFPWVGRSQIISG